MNNKPLEKQPLKNSNLNIKKRTIDPALYENMVIG
jgi:hypothetical protein